MRQAVEKHGVTGSRLLNVPGPSAPALQTYELVTWQGSRVVSDAASGAVYHGEPIAGRFGRVVAWIPPGRADMCLLFGAPATPGLPANLLLAGDPDREPVISMSVQREDDMGWSFRHPVTGLHLCAVPGDGHGGIVVADRPSIGPWERFTLRPVSDLPNALLTEIEAHATLLGAMNTAPGTLATLKAQTGNARLRPLLRVMRADDLDWLGRLLRRDADGCQAFARVFPDDPWARVALPALQSMPADPPGSGVFTPIDPSLDHLATAGFQGRFTSIPHIVNARARRDRAPTRNLCLLATVRNEGLYLLEWIAFHRALGVEAFFIYSNDNDDGSDALLHALASAGVIGWISNRTGAGVSPQYKAYGHAYQMLPDILDFRWAGVIDLDEFIVLDRSRYASLSDLIAVRHAEGADAIALSWVMFGPNGQRVRTGMPLTSRFTSRDDYVNIHVKCLGRPHRFIHSQAHYPIWEEPADVTLLAAAGTRHARSRVTDGSAFSAAPDDGTAWVAHYHTKSAEEFILRRSFSRGDMGLASNAAGGFFGAGVAQMFIDQNNGQGQVQDHRTVACVPDLAARIAALRALPGVDEAMVRIERAYSHRLSTLSHLLAGDPRFTVPGSAENWFLQTLLQSGTAAA